MWPDAVPQTTSFGKSAKRCGYWKIIRTAAVRETKSGRAFAHLQRIHMSYFYRVGADELVQIVRVLDGRRDIDAIFDESGETQAGKN